MPEIWSQNGGILLSGMPCRLGLALVLTSWEMENISSKLPFLGMPNI